MKAFLTVCVLVFGTAAGSAKAQTVNFGEDQVMAYCRALNSNNSDAWACRDAFRRDYDRTINITNSGNGPMQDIVRPAVRACRDRYFPEWNHIRYCAERQVALATRLRATATGGGPLDAEFVRACLTQFPGRLAEADDCVRTLQRLRDRN